MLLLALGVIAQSLMSLVGDLHESVLHAEAGETYTHAHAAHGHHEPDHHAGGEAPTEPDSRTADALHQLQHHGCGGHCVWIAGLHTGSSHLHWQAIALPADATLLVPPSDYTAPFRPPISA